MTENCNSKCSSCGESCSNRKEAQVDFKVASNKDSSIKKVIGVVSGKGGVGKSLVTSLTALALSRQGYKVGILDGDITGPSIPKAFGLKEKAVANQNGILPVTTATGIKVMSINLLLESETDPVVWRGPVIASTVKQFWKDVVWGELDYLLVDMPPGTGDVALTVFQSLPVEGIIIVTSPQDLVSMIVMKAVKMAEKMNVPIIGLVENMSYFTCPDNGKNYEIFGKSKIDQIAKKEGLEVLAKLPINPEIATAVDKGAVEQLYIDGLEEFGEKIGRN